MKEGRKPDYPKKILLTASFRKCHILNPKIQAPTETRTRTLAVVTGKESRRTNHYTKG